MLKDPNCHCIDPTKDLVLNPNAWVDAPAGQFGTTAPYLNEYSWQRQPSEALSIGRLFFVSRERNVKFEVRAEFQNIFNRLYFTSPIAVSGFTTTTGANPLADDQKQSEPTHRWLRLRQLGERRRIAARAPARLSPASFLFAYPSLRR